MAKKSFNPLRIGMMTVGLLLARLGLIDARRAVRTTELAWPRIITGIARMSKSTVDVAMVGIALGPAAIAGVGFATPFWLLAFMVGAGIAGGTISLVSQRFSTNRHDEIDLSVKVSGLLAVVVLLPLVVLFWTMPERFIGLIGSDAAAIEYGATYLKVVALGMPFAALNLIGSRTLVGANDSWTPMLLRAGGAIVNIVVNAVLIFGLGLGVLGAALGTVAGNVLVTLAFGVGLVRGHLPFAGKLPVSITLSGPWFDGTIARHLTRISTPLVAANLVQNGGQFPLLAIVALFGPNVVAAFVIAMRIRDFMNTPGWGFGLASSSLVGQSLGRGQEEGAEAYARDVLRFSLFIYGIAAAFVLVFAGPIARLFVSDPAVIAIAEPLIRAACLSVMFWGVISAATGPLRASGDTQWPFYGQLVGIFGVAVPLAYLGTVTPLGIVALYFVLILETGVPAAVTYYRYQTGKWKAISRRYRPAVVAGD